MVKRQLLCSALFAFAFACSSAPPSGPQPDAGTGAVPDAGAPDAGSDAGVDAGAPDAGVDAGVDAGPDAGAPDGGADAGLDTGPDAGAGGRDAGADAGPDAGSGPDGGSDGGTGGGLTVQERHAAIDALARKCQELADGGLGVDDPGYPDALLAALAAMPAVASSAREDNGNITGTFADGVFFSIYLNIARAGSDKSDGGTDDAGAPIAPPLPAPRAEPATWQGANALAAALPTTGHELPSSKKAVLHTTLSSLVKNLVMGGSEAVPDLEKLLTDRGYDVSTGGFTLDELLTPQDFGGVFYVHSHGGPLTLNHVTDYTLVTGTDVDQDYENTHQVVADALMHGQIGVALTPIFGERMYAINTAFISSRWSFEPGALVFINACDSASAAALFFANTLVSGKHASLYLGWSDESDNAVNNNAARFVFDRLLGANWFRPEFLHQRPFAWDTITNELTRVNLDHSSPTDPEGKVHHAKLLQIADGSFGLLAPSIKRMIVDETPPNQHAIKQSVELVLQGLFGSTQGSVTIDGTPVTVNAWSDTEIRVDLPSAPTKPGYSGVVMVLVHDTVESNGVPLTLWSGKLTYSEQALPDSHFADLVSSVVFDARIRADVHEFREKPHENPQAAETQEMQASLGTTVTYKHQGSTQIATATYSLSGTGTLPFGLVGTPAPYGDGYEFHGTFYPREHTLELYPSFLGATGVRTTHVSGIPDQTAVQIFVKDPKVIVAPDATGTLSRQPVVLRFSQQWKLAPDTKTNASSAFVPLLKWGEIDGDPFDVSLGEDVVTHPRHQ